MTSLINQIVPFTHNGLADQNSGDTQGLFGQAVRGKVVSVSPTTDLGAGILWYARITATSSEPDNVIVTVMNFSGDVWAGGTYNWNVLIALPTNTTQAQL